MINELRQVASFMSAGDQEIPSLPVWPDEETLNLRLNLMQEELNELEAEFYGSGDYVAMTKELCDLLYVVFGTVVALGLMNRAEAAFKAVHDSNMSKLPFEKDENGKIRKGPNYVRAEPVLREIL